MSRNSCKSIYKISRFSNSQQPKSFMYIYLSVVFVAKGTTCWVRETWTTARLMWWRSRAKRLHSKPLRWKRLGFSRIKSPRWVKTRIATGTTWRRVSSKCDIKYSISMGFFLLDCQILRFAIGAKCHAGERTTSRADGRLCTSRRSSVSMQVSPPSSNFRA